MRNRIAVGGLDYGDRAYVDFIRNAVGEGSHMFDKDVVIAADVIEAAQWTIRRSVDAVMRARERDIQRIEERAAGLRRAGAVDRWMAAAPSDVARVAEGVNGQFFHELLQEADWVDQDVVNFFRKAVARLVADRARRAR